MTLEEFRHDFIQSVKSRASSERNFLPSTFVEEAATRLADSNEIIDFTPCFYRGTGARQRHVGLDGYAFDESDYCLRLIIGDWNGRNTAPTLTQTDATKLFAQARGFLEDSFSGKLNEIEASAPAQEFVSFLSEQRAVISSYRIYLVTDLTLSARIKDWPEGEVDGKPIESHIWDISRFHRAFESISGRDELVVSFEQGGLGIPILPAFNSSSRHKSYMCVLPGSLLANTYNMFGSRLLEGNVRSFLSLRGGVNKGIRSTISHEPEMFFAYNNGITAIASDVGIAEKNGMLRLAWAKDLQIVNGGQTTASLAIASRSDKANLDDVQVQMKLSVIPANESSQIIPRISRYANSQNKVSDADFFSNHEFHRRLEEISRRLWAPAQSGSQFETHWFYERARGQYVTELAKLGKAERSRFELQNPRNQMITKTELAKFENSWLMLPHQVSKGAQKNFILFAERITNVWEEQQAAFEDVYFKRAIARAILFKTLEKLIPGENWYDGGFRAQIVTYSIAKLASMLDRRDARYDLDFEGIWRKQSLTISLTDQLRLIARSVAKSLSTPPRGTRNVTEWCKKNECWEAVQELNLMIRPNLITELKKIRH